MRLQEKEEFCKRVLRELLVKGILCIVYADSLIRFPHMLVGYPYCISFSKATVWLGKSWAIFGTEGGV